MSDITVMSISRRGVKLFYQSCIEFSCLAKVLEGFIHRRLLKQQVNCDIDPRKYVREGQQHKH